jgi:hypothetical protein
VSDRHADAAAARERRARRRDAEPQPAAGCQCERPRPLRDDLDGSPRCFACGRACPGGPSDTEHDARGRYTTAAEARAAARAQTTRTSPSRVSQAPLRSRLHPSASPVRSSSDGWGAS